MIDASGLVTLESALAELEANLDHVLFPADLNAGLQIAADLAALNPDWNSARVGTPRCAVAIGGIGGGRSSLTRLLLANFRSGFRSRLVALPRGRYARKRDLSGGDGSIGRIAGQPQPLAVRFRRLTTAAGRPPEGAIS